MHGEGGGACAVKGDMHDKGGGMHCRGCMHGRGYMHGRDIHGRGCAWQDRQPLQRTVRILLACALVQRKINNYSFLALFPLQVDYTRISTLNREKWNACNQRINRLYALGPIRTVWEMMAFNYKNMSSKTIKILNNCLRDSKFKSMRHGDTNTETSTVLDTTPENTNSSLNYTVSTTAAGSLLNGQHTLNVFTTDTSYLPMYLTEAEDNLKLCSSQFPLFQNHYSSNLKWQYTSQIKTYENIVREVFMNSTIEYSSNEDFKRCLKEEKKFPTEKHLETSKRVKDIALNMVQSDSFSEALVYTEQIADNYLDLRDTLLDYNDFNSKINEYCYWYSGICQEKNTLVSNAQAEMSGTLIGTDKVNRWFNKMGNNYGELYKIYNEDMLPTLTKAGDYLLGNITKKKLHRLLEQGTFTMGNEDLLDLNADLNEDIKYFIENVQYTEESMVKAYEQLVQLKLPILTPYNVHDLLIVQSVKDVNDAHVQEILESLKHGLDPGLVSLVKLTFQRILDSVKEVKETIINPMEDLMEEIQTLRKSLREYEESTIIDSNFFM